MSARKKHAEIPDFQSSFLKLNDSFPEPARAYYSAVLCAFVRVRKEAEKLRKTTARIEMKDAGFYPEARQSLSEEMARLDALIPLLEVNAELLDWSRVGSKTLDKLWKQTFGNIGDSSADPILRDLFFAAVFPVYSLTYSFLTDILLAELHESELDEEEVAHLRALFDSVKIPKMLHYMMRTSVTDKAWVDRDTYPSEDDSIDEALDLLLDEIEERYPFLNDDEYDLDDDEDEFDDYEIIPGVIVSPITLEPEELHRAVKKLPVFLRRYYVLIHAELVRIIVHKSGGIENVSGLLKACGVSDEDNEVLTMQTLSSEASLPFLEKTLGGKHGTWQDKELEEAVQGLFNHFLTAVMHLKVDELQNVLEDLVITAVLLYKTDLQGIEHKIWNDRELIGDQDFIPKSVTAVTAALYIAGYSDYSADDELTARDLTVKRVEACLDLFGKLVSKDAADGFGLLIKTLDQMFKVFDADNQTILKKLGESGFPTVPDDYLQMTDIWRSTILANWQPADEENLTGRRVAELNVPTEAINHYLQSTVTGIMEGIEKLEAEDNELSSELRSFLCMMGGLSRGLLWKDENADDRLKAAGLFEDDGERICSIQRVLMENLFRRLTGDQSKLSFSSEGQSAGNDVPDQSRLN